MADAISSLKLSISLLPGVNCFSLAACVHALSVRRFLQFFHLVVPIFLPNFSKLSFGLPTILNCTAKPAPESASSTDTSITVSTPTVLTTSPHIFAVTLQSRPPPKTPSATSPPPQMTIHSPLHTSRISDALLRTIYASDQEMYPAPLTYERLQSWRDACPELSICFSASGDDSEQPVGVIIVLPLVKKHWEDLLVGKIKEVDVDAEEMFAGRELQQLQAVGLHVFHIERFAAWDAESVLKKTGARPAAVTVRGCEDGKRRFADMALEEVQRRVEAAANAEVGGKRWDVLGFSALTATPAGKKTFARLGFVPTGYKEIFRLVETSSPPSPMSKLHLNGDDTGGAQNNPGPQTTVITTYIYPGKAHMGELSSGIISESEMTVRYSATSPE